MSHAAFERIRHFQASVRWVWGSGGLSAGAHRVRPYPLGSFRFSTMTFSFKAFTKANPAVRRHAVLSGLVVCPHRPTPCGRAQLAPLFITCGAGCLLAGGYVARLALNDGAYVGRGCACPFVPEPGAVDLLARARAIAAGRATTSTRGSASPRRTTPTCVRGVVVGPPARLVVCLALTLPLAPTLPLELPSSFWACRARPTTRSSSPRPPTTSAASCKAARRAVTIPCV